MPRYRSALITGASRGLGRALALNLAARGISLTLVARSETDLNELRDTLHAAAPNLAVELVVTDLADSSARALLLDRIASGEIKADVLINNAGIGSYRPFLEGSRDEIVRSMELNATAPMLLAHAMLPAMQANRVGYIINVASDLSRRPLAKMTAYVAAKHALLGFSHSLLREAKPFGIKVTAVLPGIIDSTFNGGVEGSKDVTWALRPSELAAQIAALLDTPEHLVIDELAVHPMQQDF